MRKQVYGALAAVVVGGVAPLARATDYWTPEEISARFAGQNRIGTHGESVDEPSHRFTSTDPASQIAEIARFLSTLQVANFGSSSYGGIREGESLREIVQSDNTHEAIWVWSRYEELTGDPSYRPNIDAAWFYVAGHPAFAEEGGSGPDGYYRVYNCAWALRAEVEYRRATGDPSYINYAESCAQYLLDWPLDVSGSAIAPLNAMVQAWAAGNLYAFAVDRDDAALRIAASTMGARIKEWVDVFPRVRLGIQMWAMSSGAIFWGIVESYFRLHRDEARAWIEANSPHLPGHVAGSPWNNAHDAWYAIGHWLAFRSLAHANHAESARSLVEGLLAQDFDHDGGIPSTLGGLDDQDESWTSSYLAWMGLDRRLPTLQLAASPRSRVVTRGESFVVDVAALQWTASPIFVIGSTFGYDVDGSPVARNPLLGPIGFTLPAGNAIEGLLRFRIPGQAPAGAYSLVLRLSHGESTSRAPIRFVVR